MRLSLGWLVLLLWSGQLCAGEVRIALVVGNGNYADPALRLENPVNDARAMNKALRDAAFDTVMKLNATRVELYEAVAQFKNRLSQEPHAVGLFYYAGHGVQADGVNYLVPVDAQLRSDADLDALAFDAGRVLRAMEAAQNDMNIVILDACRDNPLPKSRSTFRGLARMTAASGTFIAYAAAPGQVAHDGVKNSNGVFTGEFVKAMSLPGMPLEQMFKRVIAGVKGETEGHQQPWSESSIQGEFYFVPATKPVIDPAPAPPTPVLVDEDAALWQTIRNSHDARDFSRYLKRFPHGQFAADAHSRLLALTPSHTPPPPAATLSPPPDRANARCQALLEKAQMGEIDEQTRKGLEQCH